MNRKKRLLSLFFVSFISLSAWGQHVNIKTNLLYDATATVNLGVEVGLGKRLTLDISGNYNGWNVVDDKQWQHWLVQPELRLWTYEKFNGHFFGLHALGGQFEFNNLELPFDLYPGLKDAYYEGNFIGGGLSYGYQWMWGKRWGFEATVGVGYLYVEHERYDNPTSKTKLSDGTENYFGPTKAGLTLIYFIH